MCHAKGCAKVLHDFNGGASVVSNFLNQMDFFIAASKINAGEVIIDSTMYVALGNTLCVKLGYLS
jgi:hypothetical protein